jgi:nicotinamide-nucleotide amidase
MKNTLSSLAAKLHPLLKANGLISTTAESCTGGWIAKVLTDTPGSSATFERGFVTYSNEAKCDMLGVNPKTLENYGAVSEQIVIEMAQGALQHSRASISTAVSGIAGPTGGTKNKPVGTVWISWAREGFPTQAQQYIFDGNRETIRRQSVEQALNGLIELTRKHSKP